MSFNMFELMLERNKQKEEDKLYFSGAVSNEGRRFSHEYLTQSKLLGTGGYGFVRECRRKSQQATEQNQLAAKVVSKSVLSDWQLVPGSLTEAEILSGLSHDNIITVKDIFQNDNYFQLVMSKCSGLSLFDLIEMNKKLVENIARVIYSQVVDAVNYLHSQNIIHNDIKDENIIVSTNMKTTLIDFGSACFNPGKKTKNYCGSETYTSPEVLSGKMFCMEKQEIWSLGVLLYVMIYGENPFSNVVLAEECNLICASHTDVSRECRNLITSILVKNVEQRLNISQIINHNWLKQKTTEEINQSLGLKFE